MGDNYGLNDSYSYYEFELDSLDATSTYQQGSASTDWPLFFVSAKGPLENVAAVKVLEVQIPFSWYVFNSINSGASTEPAAFMLTETGHTAVQVPIFPITVSGITYTYGNYTASQLAPILGAALTAVSPSGYTYTVSYSSNTQKFTFYNNQSSTSPFTFTFGTSTNSGNKNPRLYLGFTPGSTASQTFSSTLPGSGFTGNALVAPNVQQVSGPNYLYINSTKIGSDVDVFLPKGADNLGGGAAGPQIAKVPVTENYNGTIYWADPDPQKWFKYDQLQSINSMDFYLTLGNTTTQNPLQLNGLSFSIKLGVLTRQKTTVDHGNGLTSNGRVYQREGPKRIRGTY